MSAELIFRDYLGDGVYVGFDGCQIIMTTGHHERAMADNVIAMEPTVLAALDRYRERLNTHLKDRGEEVKP